MRTAGPWVLAVRMFVWNASMKRCKSKSTCALVPLLTGSLGSASARVSRDKIARESIYVTEGWEPPEWRAQWRAAP